MKDLFANIKGLKPVDPAMLVEYEREMERMIEEIQVEIKHRGKLAWEARNMWLD